MRRSNCFLAAVLVAVRTGGTIRWTKPRRASPWGHFFVLWRGRKITFEAALAGKDMHWLRQLWFPGRLRRGSIREVTS